MEKQQQQQKVYQAKKAQPLSAQSKKLEQSTEGWVQLNLEYVFDGKESKQGKASGIDKKQEKVNFVAKEKSTEMGKWNEEQKEEIKQESKSQTNQDKKVVLSQGKHFEIADEFKVKLYGWLEVQVCKGDITQEKVDAITNAANENLRHGKGLAGDIRKKGGWVIQDESNDWISQNGKVYTGQCAVTGSGNFKKQNGVEYVIHAVGPIWSYGKKDDEGLLYKVVQNVLYTADDYHCSSLAIPAISSGLFHFPKPLCSQILFESIEDFAKKNMSKKMYLKYVRLTNFDDETVGIFQNEFTKRYMSGAYNKDQQLILSKEIEQQQQSYGNQTWLKNEQAKDEYQPKQYQEKRQKK